MVFLLVLGEGVERAFLKECELETLPLPSRVVNKILQWGWYGSEVSCCKNDLNTNNYERRTRV